MHCSPGYVPAVGIRKHGLSHRRYSRVAAQRSADGTQEPLATLNRQLRGACTGHDNAAAGREQTRGRTISVPTNRYGFLDPGTIGGLAGGVIFAPAPAFAGTPLGGPAFGMVDGRPPVMGFPAGMVAGMLPVPAPW